MKGVSITIMKSLQTKDIHRALQQAGIRATSPRLTILGFLENDPSHHTVDFIYNSLKDSNPSLSKTTVYNTLVLLREHGLVHAVTITENELRFEKGGPDHHHFYCIDCGLIENINIACPMVGTILKGKYHV